MLGRTPVGGHWLRWWSRGDADRHKTADDVVKLVSTTGQLPVDQQLRPLFGCQPGIVRIEELTELTHHSFVQYKLPTTGELIPLL